MSDPAGLRSERSAPSPNQIDVRARFAPLMRWVLSLWTSSDLALAIDPTTLSDRLCAIVVSVVYRGCAIPVAWVVMPANKPGKWIDLACEPLDSLVGRHSIDNAGNHDDGSRTEKPQAV